MKFVDELAALHEKLEQLEEGPSVVGDWHRLEARVGRMLIHAQNELTRLQRDLIDLVRVQPPDPRWAELRVQTRALRDGMEELRMLRLCAQSRLFEYEAADAQTEFSNWTR
jgi:hypothetical protein